MHNDILYFVEPNVIYGGLTNGSLIRHLNCSVYVVCVCVAGKMIHSMVAHLDAVTCLAVDPNGLYLLSGSMSFHLSLIN